VVETIETGTYTNVNHDFDFARRVISGNGLSQEFRGDVIYCRGRKTGPVVTRWPKELYYP
jgi:hypothetical protein